MYQADGEADLSREVIAVDVDTSAAEVSLNRLEAKSNDVFKRTINTSRRIVSITSGVISAVGGATAQLYGSLAELVMISLETIIETQAAIVAASAGTLGIMTVVGLGFNVALIAGLIYKVQYLRKQQEAMSRDTEMALGMIRAFSYI